MIFVSGNVIGSYRAQNIIKLITDNNIKFSHIPFFITLNTIFPLKLIIAFISIFILLPARILLLAKSKTVVILPMNNNIFSLFDTLIGRVFNKKVIFEFYISNYDSMVNDRKILSEGSLKAKYILFIEKLLTKYATKIICLNDAEKNYYINFMDLTAKEKAETIPLVIDRMTPRTEYKASYSPIVLCWWGTYIPLHGLDKLIKAIKLIDNIEIKLYIFGNSNEKSQPYKNLVSELELSSKIEFNNEFTFKNGKLPEFLINNCDLALGNFGSSEKAKTVLVNKVVDTIALNLPCLTMQTKACDEFFIANENIFLTKEDPTPEDIANAIITIIDNNENLFKISKNGHHVYNDYFSPEAFSKKYLPLLK